MTVKKIRVAGFKAAHEVIPGGEASGKDLNSIDSKQIITGMAVELEHTGDWQMALEIAKDHLAEDPGYYSNVIPGEEVRRALLGIAKKVAKARAIKKIRVAGFMEDTSWEWFPSSEEFLSTTGSDRPIDGLPSQVREKLPEGIEVRSWTSDRYPSGANYELDIEITVQGEFGVSEEEFDPDAMREYDPTEEETAGLY